MTLTYNVKFTSNNKLYESHVEDTLFTKNAMLKVPDNSFLLLKTCM